MNIDNAARKPEAIDAHRSLHLVHSRDWQQEGRRSKPAMQTQDEAQGGPDISERHAAASLAAAALVAPAIWMGHALLRWMHVI